MEENNVALPQAQETSEASNTEQFTQQTTDTTTQQPEQQKFKVKYLHEEREVPYDEAPTYIQKGMDYDRVREKYEESKPVVGFVEKLAQQNGMTVPEYLRAVDEYQRQQEIQDLQQRTNLDSELAEELYYSRQERHEREQRRQQEAQEKQQQQEYIEFLTEFKGVSAEDIPQEVWRLKAEKGISITDAYTRYQYGQIKGQQTAQEANAKNAQSSTGSLTGNGETPNSYISRDVFEQNKNDRNWVIKNFNKLNESRAKW